jgi:hypothetical protein
MQCLSCKYIWILSHSTLLSDINLATSNHAEAVNTILFNTKNVLGRNAGVLIAWAALSTFTTVGLTWYGRREKVAKYRAGLINKVSS